MASSESTDKKQTSYGSSKPAQSTLDRLFAEHNSFERERQKTIRVLEWNSVTCCSDIPLFVYLNSLFFPSNFPVRRFPLPCSFIRNSLLFLNRELPSNHLKYRGLPRQKTAGSAQKWPRIPCFSLLFMVTSRDRIAPTCTIRHPVWPIVALQRRVEIFRAVGGVLQG